MWILFARAPPEDVAYWPGRRGLAALDAVAWPLLWVLGIAHLPVASGLAGPLVQAIAALLAFARLHKALVHNQRYRFTTWRWCRWLASAVADRLDPDVHGRALKR
jgi:hypothetical protein